MGQQRADVARGAIRCGSIWVHGRSAIAVMTLIILSWPCTSPAQATPLPNGDRPVTYTVIDQDLREVLAEVGRQSGLRVSVSEGLRGQQVHGRLPPAPLGAFLDRLSSIYGFDWYFDGGVLHVSAMSEAGSRVLPLGSVEFNQLTRTLVALGIADGRWPLRGSNEAGVALVDGPPRYLQLVEQSLAALSRRSDGAAPVRVFRGTAQSPIR